MHTFALKYLLLAGIYIHIPYCKQACTYCNFHFSTNLTSVQKMVTAICEEIILRKNYLNNAPIETIYFGGGTPGILDVALVEEILVTIKNNFDTSNVKEITLEANPDDMLLDKLIALKKIGINRLSVGVQSFNAADLAYMNRAHNVTQAEQCLKDASAVGFNNISADLIYGYPLLSDAKFIENLNKMLALGVTHLSCYAMTVEPKTALAKNIETKKMQPIDAEQSAHQFELLMQWAAQNNFEHYEISNFAKPNSRAIHNSNYWNGVPYLGIGPSASSYNGQARHNCIANNALYIAGINNGAVILEEEILTHSQKINEYIMISMRTKEGMDMQKLKSMMSDKQFKNTIEIINGNKDLLTINDTYVALNNKGKLFADGLAADLFV
jgi:oxygen-independent coproporphyrinogen III oxidase